MSFNDGFSVYSIPYVTGSDGQVLTIVNGQWVAGAGLGSIVSAVSTSNGIIGDGTGGDPVRLDDTITVQNLYVEQTASIAHIDYIYQQSLIVGDKYITLMSGANNHSLMDGSGILWGSGSTDPTTGDQGSTAYVLYRNNTRDQLEIFPGLYVSGSITASSGISGSLVGTASYSLDSDKLDGFHAAAFAQLNQAALFTQVTASQGFIGNLTGSFSGSNPSVIDVSSSLPALTLTQRGLGHVILIEDSRPDTNPFIINGDGKVGIGTTSPISNLQIVGSLIQGLSAQTSIGAGAHAEGDNTQAFGNYSHAEGLGTQASGSYSHAEGRWTIATGSFAHAEGDDSEAYGSGSHAEGYNCKAFADYSHAEGDNTKTYGLSSHAEGYVTNAYGARSHAEGLGTQASGNYSHAEGYNTITSGTYSHAEGWTTKAVADFSHAEGYSTNTYGVRSHAEGRETNTYGASAHAEGYQTNASGNFSHAEGYLTVTYADGAHAEGRATHASGSYSHAEGQFTVASGAASHAEGDSTNAIGFRSHAEGWATTASSNSSHAEGFLTIASGIFSHAEGSGTKAFATHTHTEGWYTEAHGHTSHAEGIRTIASGTAQHVAGVWNATSSDALYIIGNGNGDNVDNPTIINRSNIFEVYMNRAVVSGSLSLTGGFQTPIKKVTTDYSFVTGSDFTVLFSGSTGLTGTLPAAAEVAGFMFNAKNLSVNRVFITASSGKIEGSSVGISWNSKASYTFQSDGTDWYII